MKRTPDNQLCAGKFQNIEFFSGITPATVSLLLHGATREMTAHRQFVINEGEEADYFMLVLTGSYKLLKKIGDTNTIFDFAVKNDLIGAILMNDSKVFPISVASIGCSEYLKVPKKTYQEYWTKEADVMTRVQAATVRRIEALQFGRVLQDLPTEKKMAGLLLRLAAMSNSNQSHIIEIPLTRKDLAEAIGIRVETAIRLLSSWQKMGILNSEQKNIELIKPDQLVKIYQN